MKNETLGLLLGVLFLFSAAALADTHIPGGFVSGTWTLAGSPYILDGNVVIHQDSTLTIQPGVDVMMDPFRRIRIEGQILAVGSEQDSIRFIATDMTHGSEGVDFLNTNSSPRDSSKLVYCEIKYGTASPYPDLYMHGGGLYIKNSSRLQNSHCLISHCRTRDVFGANGANGYSGQLQGGPGQLGGSVEAGKGGAVYCEDSSPAFFFNMLSNNHTGTGSGGHGGRGGNATNLGGGGTAWGGNGGQGGAGHGGDGGGIHLKNSAAAIHENLFVGNRTGDGCGGHGGSGGYGLCPDYFAIGGNGGHGGEGHGGGGAAINLEMSLAAISNNLMLQNTTGDGYGGAGGNGGNAISAYQQNPGYGGTGGDANGGSGYAILATSNSFDYLNCCTITNHNHLSIGLGGVGGRGGNGGPFAPPGQGYNGRHVILGPNLHIQNSILWNNADPTISSTASVTYSCIQGGFPGVGNINVDPLFVSTPQGSYFLSQIAAGQSQQSPCVDAGNPSSPMIIGTTRTDGVQDAGLVDMGYHFPLFTPMSPVSITLTPYGTPIQVPANGGSFNYNIAAANSGSAQVIADVWCMVTLPNGSSFGPVLGPVTITMPTGYSNNRDRTQSVPASAPAGNYIYHGYIGDYPAKWDSSSFTFEKLGAGDSGLGADSWSNTGEEFGEVKEPFITHHSSLITSLSPNPFNAQTTIRYELPYLSHVQLAVYDVRGRLVADLVDGVRSAGVQELTFDAAHLPSGMYFYRLQANGHSEVRKMMLVK